MVAVVGVGVAQVLVEVVYDEVFVVVVVVAVLVVAQVLVEVVYAEVLVVVAVVGVALVVAQVLDGVLDGVFDVGARCPVWCAKGGKMGRVPQSDQLTAYWCGR